MVRMQQALATLGRAWSFRISTPTTVVFQVKTVVSNQASTPIHPCPFLCCQTSKVSDQLSLLNSRACTFIARFFSFRFLFLVHDHDVVDYRNVGDVHLDLDGHLVSVPDLQTNRGRLGAPPAATKPPSSPAGRMRWRREEEGVVGFGFHSWGPIRAASSQETSSEMALEKKKCVPCETGKLQPMSEEKAQSLLPKVSGWELKEIDGVLQLQRDWKAKSFVKGLEIMKRVADVAEAEGHHPDLHLVNWNQLSINISTHAVGGLTENDFIVAAKIGALDLADLVRKPKAAAKHTLKPSST